MRKVIAVSVPDREGEVIDFLNQLDRGEQSRFILEAIKLALARFDMSYVHIEIEQLKTKLHHLEAIKNWKDAWDKVEMENLVRLQHSEVLKKYSKWYNVRLNMSKKIADTWLDDVLPDIQDELEYQLTIEQFMEFNKKRGVIIGANKRTNK